MKISRNKQEIPLMSFAETAQFKPGSLIVVGGSSSEVRRRDWKGQLL